MPSTHGRLPPAWTLGECAAHFGTTAQSLTLLLRYRGGPKPVLRFGQNFVGTRRTYYDSVEMTRWYKGLVL